MIFQNSYRSSAERHTTYRGPTIPSVTDRLRIISDPMPHDFCESLLGSLVSLRIISDPMPPMQEGCFFDFS